MAALGLGQAEDGRGYIEQALAINPSDSRLHNFMGQVLDSLNEHVEAERALGQAVTLDPGFLEAWCNLGLIQLRANRAAEAAVSFRKALNLAPEDGELHFRLGQALYFQRDITGAEQCLRTALDKGGFPGKINFWLCVILRAQGKREEAERLEAQTRLQYSQNGEAYPLLVELGRSESQVGKLDEAQYWLNRAIEMKPDEAHAYVELASTRKFSDADRDLAKRMEGLIELSVPAVRRGLGFALGKIYGDLREYEASFKYYRLGNDVVREQVPYDALEFEQEIGQKIEWFTASRLAKMPPGSDSDIPIIIVGTPRSGTTLTEQIISSHSLVGGAGELTYWGRLGSRVMDGFPESYNASVAKILAEGYLGYLKQHATNAIRITDKMPGNFFHLGLIHAVFPNARIVHCRRHPIDACLSIYFQNFPDGHSYKWDMESLAHWYGQYVRLMDHWRTVLPEGVMFEMQYEELTENPESVSRQLMEFMGMEWESGQLEFYKQDRAVFTASKWQARQPIYKTSKERWRQYEKFIGPLMSLLKYLPAK
jgi:Tfp pilus assembly protein PilF